MTLIDPLFAATKPPGVKGRRVHSVMQVCRHGAAALLSHAAAIIDAGELPGDGVVAEDREDVAAEILKVKSKE